MSATSHFASTTGYGYNDLGRDTLEDVYASVFHGESALVRPQLDERHPCRFMWRLSGQPAAGGRALVAQWGSPMTHWRKSSGIRGFCWVPLRSTGLLYRQVDLLEDGSFDYDGIAAAINERTKLVTIQRSKGYATRPTLFGGADWELIAFIKEQEAGRYLHGG
ncbi:MAG: methionine gamma-lyase family protein [Enterocloster bolteae]